MRRFAFPALVAVGCLALASCAEAAGTTSRPEPTTTTAASVGRGRASCPTTRPPRPAFVPPKPYRATPPPLYRGMVWYGSDALWTWLHQEGTWEMARNGEARFDKSFWWRAGFDPLREPNPDLSLTARRLDTQGPVITASDGAATHGWRDDGDIGAFVLTGIELPAGGCWEITGHYGSAALTLVVWVP